MTEFQGTTIQDAIETGLKELKLQREQIAVDVISEGHKGFLGIGRHPAIVDIRPLDSIKNIVDAANNTNEQINKIQTYLENIVDKLDYAQTVVWVKNPENLKFEIKTDEPDQARVIGKHGKNINALQTIVQEYAYYLDFRDQPVLLDCGGYRQRRQEALIALSTFKAEQVQVTHKPTYLDPMPALERKVIYENLADNKQVVVRTQGHGLERYLVIRPR